MITVYIDGSARPTNPGEAWYAYYIDYGNGQQEYARRKFSDNATNNEAEYEALRRALLCLATNNKAYERILIRSDSRLVVNQMNGKWRITNDYALPIKQLLVSYFPYVIIEWIPREENEVADELSKNHVPDRLRH